MHLPNLHWLHTVHKPYMENLKSVNGQVEFSDCMCYFKVAMIGVQPIHCAAFMINPESLLYVDQLLN